MTNEYTIQFEKIIDLAEMLEKAEVPSTQENIDKLRSFLDANMINNLKSRVFDEIYACIEELEESFE